MSIRRTSLVIGSVLIVILGALSFRSFMPAVEARRLIAAYSESPDQGTADRLAAILGSGLLSPEDANRALEVLLRPEYRGPESFRPGQELRFSLKRPFEVGLHSMSFFAKQDIYVEGERIRGSRSEAIPGSSSGRMTLSPGTEVINYPDVPEAPGTYTMTVKYEYGLSPKENVNWRTEEPTYHCSFTVPVTLRVVGAETTP